MALQNLIYYKIINPNLMSDDFEIIHFEVNKFSKNSYEVKLFNESIKEPFSIIAIYQTDSIFLNDRFVALATAKYLLNRNYAKFKINF
jgi:hypothetical protein